MTDNELDALEIASRCGYPVSPLAVLKLCAEYKEMLADRRNIVAMMADVVGQACPAYGDDGVIDSMSLSAYADAIRFLAEEGVLNIDAECGRRVIARRVENKDEPE